MYVGFLNDTIFKKKTAVGSAATTYGQCVIDKKLLTYFNKEMIITDPRSSRLNLGGKVVKGTLSFHYDGNRHSVPNNPSKDDLFKYLTVDDLKAFFTIVEMVSLANGSSQDELNTNLYDLGSIKSYYIKDSLKLARTVVSSVIYDIDGLTPETQISLVTFFTVDIKFPDREIETFKVYLDRETFLESYPYSTINNVILPCDPTYLLDPSRIDGTVDALVKAGSYSFKDLDPSIIADDHTGLLTYTTKYYSRAGSGAMLVHYLPFGILYQGAKPPTLQMREAIRNELFKEGLASEEIWESILPDIFVTASFYLIPIWDNQIRRPQGYIYPSVVPVKKIQDAITTLFPSMSQDFIKEHQELLTIGQSEIFITSIPDLLNEDSNYSILEIHPTYQYHLSQDGSAFLNQDAVTRDFNIRLNRALAVAFGTELHDEVITTTLDGLTWHTFTSSRVEYNVLSKASYDALFGTNG